MLTKASTSLYVEHGILILHRAAIQLQAVDHLRFGVIVQSSASDSSFPQEPAVSGYLLYLLFRLLR